MGMSKTAIWIALFALVANAGSGLGLELVSPANCVSRTTVCDAQTMITALLDTVETPDNSGDVCELQGTLDQTCKGESASTPTASLELALQDRNPECTESLIVITPIDVLALTESLVQSMQDAVVPPVNPPGLRPVIVRRASTQSPNAPPHLA